MNELPDLTGIFVPSQTPDQPADGTIEVTRVVSVDVHRVAFDRPLGVPLLDRTAHLSGEVKVDRWGREHFDISLWGHADPSQGTIVGRRHGTKVHTRYSGEYRAGDCALPDWLDDLVGKWIEELRS